MLQDILFETSSARRKSRNIGKTDTMSNLALGDIIVFTKLRKCRSTFEKWLIMIQTDIIADLTNDGSVN